MLPFYPALTLKWYHCTPQDMSRSLFPFGGADTVSTLACSVLKHTNSPLFCLQRHTDWLHEPILMFLCAVAISYWPSLESLIDSSLSWSQKVTFLPGSAGWSQNTAKNIIADARNSDECYWVNNLYMWVGLRPKWLTCKTHLAHSVVCMHACTHDRLVDELRMPLRRAARGPSHGRSFPFAVF